MRENEGMATLRVAGSVACFALFLAAFASWVIVLVNMFRMVANRKPGVPLFPGGLQSPFNIVFRPHQLTEAGLRARRLCLWGTLGLVLSMALAATIGIATGALH